MATSEKLAKSISQASTTSTPDITALKVLHYTVPINKSIIPVQIKGQSTVTNNLQDVPNSSTEGLEPGISSNIITSSSSNSKNLIESSPVLGITNNAVNTSISFSHDLVPTTISSSKDNFGTCSSPQPSVQFSSSQTSTGFPSNTLKGSQLLAQLLVPSSIPASKDDFTATSLSPQSSLQFSSPQTSSTAVNKGVLSNTFTESQSTTVVTTGVPSNTFTESQLLTPSSINVGVPVNKTPLAVPQEQNFRWGRKQVNALLDKVSDHFEAFYDHSVKKKEIWKIIAAHMSQEGYKCTSSDCDKKWRNLKSTYLKVLRKQIQGSTDYRFEHFSRLHTLLGKEIDPLGMREQAISDVKEQAIVEKANHDDSASDEEDDCQWDDNSIDHLLNLIQEESLLLSSENANTAWKKISQQMNEYGHIFSVTSCRNKWLSLRRDFNYYQQAASQSGSVPLWPFFTRVRHVLSSFSTDDNVVMPIHFEEVNSQKYGTGSVLERLEKINREISVNERLAKLEANVEASQKIKEARAQTNNLLQQVLSELRSITDSLEAENGHGQIFEQRPNPSTHMSTNDERHQQQQHHQQQQNNQPGIIIVEAYQDELT